MTLTDTLDHLLSVFLRPLRTWIEREVVAPLRAAYDAAMQTKEQYRDGVYLHLKERLEGTEEHPLAEGVPVRPLPEPQDLAHLQSAVELLGERKITGVQETADGMNILRLILSGEADNITELVDDNFDWDWTRETAFHLTNIFPNLTRIVVGCKSIPNIGNQSSYIAGANRELHLPNLETCSQTNNSAPCFQTGSIFFENFKSGTYRVGGSASWHNSVTTKIYIGCKGAKTDTIRFWEYTYAAEGQANYKVTDVEIRDGACQRITLEGLYALTASNIVNHIFNRLADNNDGDPITITLGSTNLAKLTDEEKQIAIDKNYILA